MANMSRTFDNLASYTTSISPASPTIMIHHKWILILATYLTAAVPVHACEPTWICVDGINDCGVQFGGCYDICHPENAPKPPPCEDDCHTRTVCVDAINECGTRFGGCEIDNAQLLPGLSTFAVDEAPVPSGYLWYHNRADH
ncbi:hypothetical protein EDB81DRAFT_884469 [Dactylonectria macrodidyma]|uniref:Uncharacterized protein n=1 Tax=Dactylonectria macrodidyma TaxID=307937 RepID=A0A9P9ET57_9HYPO|nr:hypothetical protein EDB81DRAFT_884469 [Dactylonectria macrodidyma]